MAVKTIEGSFAVAESVRNCEPEVVACYPITPSTHVAERLAKYYSDGEIKEYITVEAEFSAISALIGASAAGARTFSVTCGQGLLLMHEALCSVPGMRLPIVMGIANRAFNSPLNIWNDEQDSFAQRDSGWIQIYCKSNQEAVDSIIQAYKIAEKVSIPAMVCFDGFYLTHAVEQIDIPSRGEIAKFLPPFKPQIFLDPENPLTIGAYANPNDYQEFKEDLEKDMMQCKKVVEEAGKEFGKLFGRHYGLMDEYKTKDAVRIIVGVGSVMENVYMVVDELRAKGEKVGALHLRLYRPFPSEEIAKALSGKNVGVIEKALSVGGVPPVYVEIVEALSIAKDKAIVSSFVGGLGGREIKREDIFNVFKKLKEKKPLKEWIAVKK